MDSNCFIVEWRAFSSMKNALLTANVETDVEEKVLLMQPSSRKLLRVLPLCLWWSHCCLPARQYRGMFQVDSLAARAWMCIIGTMEKAKGFNDSRTARSEVARKLRSSVVEYFRNTISAEKIRISTLGLQPLYPFLFFSMPH